MNLVIVESPAKAITINKYLGNDYNVIASFGHVRDLASRNGSVDINNNFSMVWESDQYAQKKISEIISVACSADNDKLTLYLATDPDREGEAIAWHILDILQEKKIIHDNNSNNVYRVIFHEITKNTIIKAIASPSKINYQLVNAYFARRALDYLFGFNLSPILWYKLPGSRSAGRVQSVALRLIYDRELEIECFNSKEYWSLEGTFKVLDKMIKTQLTHFNHNKLNKFSLKNEDSASFVKSQVKEAVYYIKKVSCKTINRLSKPPFITATLQQKASQYLGFSTKYTMNIAQILYEGIDISGERLGLITYIRTDSTFLSKECISQIRLWISRQYGNQYLYTTSRYGKTSKKVQGAHEAIRPTDIFRCPDDMISYLTKEQLLLYTLIWKRTIASQMSDALFDETVTTIASKDDSEIFSTKSIDKKFDGFSKLYDKKNQLNFKKNRISDIKSNIKVDLVKLEIMQNFTKPLPRYTEATLVKKMETIGIGRPSTYASIISVLQNRNYVRLIKKNFIIQDRGRIVTSFLLKFFQRYIEYHFTADLENQLDNIALGKSNWSKVLKDFWKPFHFYLENAKNIKRSKILNMIQLLQDKYLFSESVDNEDPHICIKCKSGKMMLKISKFGIFLGCSNYPICKHTRSLGKQSILYDHPKTIGYHENQAIILREGPYGRYLEIDINQKKMRISVPKDIDLSKIDLSIAKKILHLK